MSKKILNEAFQQKQLDPRLKWYCPPASWSLEGNRLSLQPDPKTDYWQKTHYGFANDNGHFLYLEAEGDFVLETQVSLHPAHRFDQAGLMVRLSPDFWLKTSVEYETEGPSKLGAVVTNYGYSDWSFQNFEGEFVPGITLRIHRTGDDYIVEHLQEVLDGHDGLKPQWAQLRVAHLHNLEHRPVQCGLYACSPIEAGFKAEFGYLRVEKPD